MPTEGSPGIGSADVPAVDQQAGSRARVLVGCALALLAAVAWALTHHYMGMAYDAKLYAFQALARVHPQLASDLFLQYATQDKFSIFSRVYAPFIRAFGLEPAALGLFLVFTTGFYAGAWHVARSLLDPKMAWLALLMLVALTGHYGAGLTFRYSENFLTARTAAECLVMTALALDLRGRSGGAWALAALALCVHPIMGLPGLALILGRRLPANWIIGLALTGVGLVMLAAVAARAFPAVGNALHVMDGDWLDITRERSQFLFLDLWNGEDWKLNLFPFVCLALYAQAFPDARVRRLCWLIMLVAGVGLVLAAIASLVSPIGLLVQAQTWRWVWLAKCFSVLLLLPAVLTMRHEPFGLLCGVLLVLGWTFPALEPLWGASAALGLWSFRGRLGAGAGRMSAWLAVAIAVVVILWLIAELHTAVGSRFDTGAEPLQLQMIENFLGLQLPLVLLLGALWWLIMRLRRPAIGAALTLSLLGVLAWVTPWALMPSQPVASTSGAGEFTDWRARIPPASTVVVITDRVIGGFIWFLLDRPAYLSEPQSAGVVFSRRTALEIRRRSDHLSPLMDPDWKVLSALNRLRTAQGADRKPRVRALTPALLRHACSDPLLGFVVARENIGFGAEVHRAQGPWQDWSLYDCRAARGARPPGAALPPTAAAN